LRPKSLRLVRGSRFFCLHEVLLAWEVYRGSLVAMACVYSHMRHAPLQLPTRTRESAQSTCSQSHRSRPSPQFLPRECSAMMSDTWRDGAQVTCGGNVGGLEGWRARGSIAFASCTAPPPNNSSCSKPPGTAPDIEMLRNGAVLVAPGTAPPNSGWSCKALPSNGWSCKAMEVAPYTALQTLPDMAPSGALSARQKWSARGSEPWPSDVSPLTFKDRRRRPRKLDDNILPFVFTHASSHQPATSSSCLGSPRTTAQSSSGGFLHQTWASGGERRETHPYSPQQTCSTWGCSSVAEKVSGKSSLRSTRKPVAAGRSMSPLSPRTTVTARKVSPLLQAQPTAVTRIVVSSAGKAETNGTYRLAEGSVQEGRAVYVHTERPKYKVQYAGRCVWSLNDDQGVGLYKAQGRQDTTIPLNAQWSAVQPELRPAPTVKEEPPPVYFLSARGGKHLKGSQCPRHSRGSSPPGGPPGFLSPRDRRWRHPDAGAAMAGRLLALSPSAPKRVRSVPKSDGAVLLKQRSSGSELSEAFNADEQVAGDRDPAIWNQDKQVLLGLLSPEEQESTPSLEPEINPEHDSLLCVSHMVCSDNLPPAYHNSEVFGLTDEVHLPPESSGISAEELDENEQDGTDDSGKIVPSPLRPGHVPRNSSLHKLPLRQRLAKLDLNYLEQREQARVDQEQVMHQVWFEALPEDETHSVHAAFRVSKLDDEGYLESSELFECLREMGLSGAIPKEKRAVAVICFEQSLFKKRFAMHEFAHTVVTSVRERLVELRADQLFSFFCRYDNLGSGIISLRDVRDIGRAFGIDRCHITKACEDLQQQDFLREVSAGASVPQEDAPAEEDLPSADVLPTQEAAPSHAPRTSLQGAPKEGVDFETLEKVIATCRERSVFVVRARERALQKAEKLSQRMFEEFRLDLVTLHNIFLRNDDDGSGTLDHGEVMMMLKEFGLYPQTLAEKGDIEAILGKIGKLQGATGGFNFPNFLVLVREIRTYQKMKRIDEQIRLFNKYDRDKGGTLSIQEVSRLLTDMGNAPRCQKEQEDVAALIEMVDVDGSGTLDFQEMQDLCQYMFEKLKSVEYAAEVDLATSLGFSGEELREFRYIFTRWDTDQSNSMEIHELKSAVATLGMQVSAEAFMTTFKQLDTSGNGSLEFIEFIEFMRSVRDADGIFETDGVRIPQKAEEFDIHLLRNLLAHFKLCNNYICSLCKEDLVELFEDYFGAPSGANLHQVWGSITVSQLHRKAVERETAMAMGREKQFHHSGCKTLGD